MKNIFCFFLMLTALQAQAQKSSVDNNFHVYLLIGQSNMAGRGELDAARDEVHPQILMLDKENKWVPAKDPVHFDKPYAGVGPGISFAKEMAGQDENSRIGVIPCALGGSPIKVWEPGAVYLKEFHPYDDAIRRARLAMEQGVLRGIIWHQGESDNDSARAAVYLQKLTTLVNRLRTDLKQPDLPFVAGEIGYFNKENHINTIINQLPQRVPNTAVVSARNLKDKGDKLHFDAPSARELGKRYAAAMRMLQTIGKTRPTIQPAKGRKELAKQPVVVLSFDDAEVSHYTIVAPLLKKYNFDATFFVCEMPRKSPGDSVYYMKWPQIAELHKMGFEIGNHTGHHKNMTKLSRDEMQQEVRYIEAKCREHGIPKPLSFAYPGNRADSLSQVVLQEMGYRFARAGGSSYYEPAQVGRLVIPSYTMGSSEKLEERTWNALKSLQPGQIVVFTIHGVPDIAHPDYTTSEEVFTQYLQYMNEHNFKVIAVRDLEKYIPSEQKDKPITKPIKSTYE